MVTLFCGTIWFKSGRMIQSFQNCSFHIIEQLARRVLIFQNTGNINLWH